MVLLFLPSFKSVYINGLVLAVRTYQRVKYDPLTIEEAKCCLKSFVKQVYAALNQMHQCVW